MTAGPVRPLVALDTNVLVAAGFRPGSASGRLAAAVRAGRLAAAWSEPTRAEVERVLGQIPPLRSLGVAGLFEPAHRVAVALDPETLHLVPAGTDRQWAALALEAGVPLVTADRPLAEGAARHGAEVWSPREALARLA